MSIRQFSIQTSNKVYSSKARVTSSCVLVGFLSDGVTRPNKAPARQYIGQKRVWIKKKHTHVRNLFAEVFLYGLKQS